MTFTLQTIRVPCADPEQSFDEPDAVVSGPFAVHQTRWSDGRKARAWTLTHLPSGRFVTQEATSRKAAIRLAETLAPLLDWTVQDPHLIVNGDAALKPRVLSAIFAANEWEYPEAADARAV